MKHIAPNIKSKVKLTSFESLETKYYCEKGSPKRDAYETAFKEEIIGDILKKIRELQN